MKWQVLPLNLIKLFYITHDGTWMQQVLGICLLKRKLQHLPCCSCDTNVVAIMCMVFTNMYLMYTAGVGGGCVPSRTVYKFVSASRCSELLGCHSAGLCVPRSLVLLSDMACTQHPCHMLMQKDAVAGSCLQEFTTRGEPELAFNHDVCVQVVSKASSTDQ